MKNVKIFIGIILISFVFIGCGTKRQNFEPRSISGKISYDGNLPASIIDVTRSGATLKNGQIITKNGLLNVKLPQGYKFLNDSQGKYLATSNSSLLAIFDKNSKVIYKKDFKSVIATAALKGNILAVILGNNQSLLIDTVTNKIVYKNIGDDIYAVDSKIAAPYFLSSLVIFPTLDGKLIIVDLKKYSVVKEVVVKSEKFFSNIIFMDVLGDRLVAATKNRMISINPKSISFLDKEIKDAIISKNRVLVFTKDGQVILTDANLKVLKSKKYRFASFAGAIHGKYVYVIERGGFLIATDLDLMSSNVYELPDNINAFVFATKDKLYFNDKYFKLGK